MDNTLILTILLGI